MPDFTLFHQPHQHYSSAMATGVAIQGPLGDGMVHLTFYRDASRLVKEEFTAEEADGPLGKVVTVTPRPGMPEVQHFREDVATILIPAEKFAGFATAIQGMNEQIQKIAGLSGS